MFFSKKEESIMKPLMSKISDCPEEEYLIKFKNGIIVKAKVDTCYETDNGKEETETGYEEMFACLMVITDVIADNNLGNYKKGEMFEITYNNYPIHIMDSNGNSL